MNINKMNKTVKLGFMAMGVFAVIVVIGIISLIFEGVKSRNNVNVVENDIVIENNINE